jgi:mannose/fructose/N-acetylgalactosamine-specific phosphotransferase system component IIB
VIAFVRVDNRLIHGQVVEAWLPHLKVARVVVADDEAAESPLIRAAMGLAVQSSVEVQIAPLKEVDFPKLAQDGRKTLVLVRDVGGVVEAHKQGMPVGHLNLGNVHYATGRRQVSPSVFLSADEVAQLEALAKDGAEIEVRGVPNDKPIALTEIQERFQKGNV